MKKLIKAQIRFIQIFVFIKMSRIDWINSITSAYLITKIIYILLVVDYFTRFIKAKIKLKYTIYKIINIFENYIFSKFGYNKAVYCNNGIYFINQKV